jgi:hypothetical protein
MFLKKEAKKRIFKRKEEKEAEWDASVKTIKKYLFSSCFLHRYLILTIVLTTTEYKFETPSHRF